MKMKPTGKCLYAGGEVTGNLIALRHVQRTFHIQGSEKELNPLAKRLLGVRLEAIKAAF